MALVLNLMSGSKNVDGNRVYKASIMDGTIVGGQLPRPVTPELDARRAGIRRPADRSTA